MEEKQCYFTFHKNNVLYIVFAMCFIRKDKKINILSAVIVKWLNRFEIYMRFLCKKIISLLKMVILSHIYI